MQTVLTVTSLRESVAKARGEGQRVGLVPTMGALHEGHFSLVRESLRRGHFTLVSIFVNPAQFGPNEDFSRYPRTLDDDARALAQQGAHVLFAPDVAEIYPDGFSTAVSVKKIPEYLCGPFRPGHFDGVATVVAKLLNMAGADEAFFGEKDWQQVQIITRLARDLNIPTRIVGMPIVREADGLALSSRNRYLDEGARKTAALIPATLSAAAQKIRATPDQAEQILKTARETLLGAGFALDYLEMADAETCAPTRALHRPARLFVAAKLTGANGAVTRLIDNWDI